MLPEYLGRASALETFEAQAFAGDENYPEHLCDFLLGLALAYNDLKDVLDVYGSFPVESPVFEDVDRTVFTHWIGLNGHFIRSIVGILHELVKLLERNKAVVASPAFARLTRRLSKPQRQAWEALEKASSNTPGTDTFSRFLVLARNKVAFHYDAAQIGRAFRRSFLGTGREPYISRGFNMDQTRFHFADSAASEFIGDLVGAPSEYALVKALEVLLGDSSVMPHVMSSLHEIIFRFITLRGYAWRQPNPA